MSKIEFQSIFISYSTIDREFAKMINSEFRRYGISTFLWETDTIGGKKLEEIMEEGIQSKDRILFIASENSLRSEACQFELSEGRKRQEKQWKNILFPIHIDNYLFEVKKRDIRPINIQDEYWKNITELRLTNSISFIEYANNDSIDSIEFKTLFSKLLKGLKSSKST